MRLLERGERYLVALLLAVLILQLVLSMRVKTITGDELAHLPAGYSYLRTNDFRMNPEHPPLIKEWAAIPLLFLDLRLDLESDSWRRGEEDRFGREFFYENTIPADTILLWGRVPIVILSALLGLLVFAWARGVYGIRAGLLALFLYTFSPNILAHSSLVNTDLGVACFIFLAVLQFRRYVEEPSRNNLALAGLALGLALSSKFAALVLFPILAILFGLALQWSRPERGAGSLLIDLLLLVAIAFLVILFCYGLFSARSYITGLREVLFHSQVGHPAFLMGQYSMGGWWYYFIVAFLIKTPLPTLLFLALSLSFLPKVKGIDRLEEAFLLAPTLLIFVLASFSRLNIGLRHILPIYPFLFVFISKIANLEFKRPILWGSAAALLCLWYLTSTVAISPHYLAYFNELVGGPQNAPNYLSDSNIDWGQDLKLLKGYMDREGIEEIILSYFGDADPNYYGIRNQYLPAFGFGGPLYTPSDYVLSSGVKREVLAISVSSLQGVFFEDHDLYGWLRRYDPIEKIGYTIYVYDITGDAEAHLDLGVVYFKFGLNDMAEAEFKKALAIDPHNQEAKRYLAQMSR